MGIGINAAAIAIGCYWGSKIKYFNTDKLNRTFGIGIIVISLVGFFENIYFVQNGDLVSNNLIVILLTYLLGSIVGDKLNLDSKLSVLGNTKNTMVNGLIDTTLLFGIGGLQISGPMLLALQSDNSQLLLKSLIDFPLALAAGAAYGKVSVLSAIPVAVTQILIATIVSLCADLFNADMIMQLCALGYLILFFSGFNLLTDKQHKINNIGMLPGMLLIILYNTVLWLAEELL